MKRHCVVGKFVIALAGTVLLASAVSSQAQERVRGGIFSQMFGPQAVIVPPDARPREVRLPAIVRIDEGLTPYEYEGKTPALVNRDQVQSNVMSFFFYFGQPGLRYGHGLAPNYSRIVTEP